ncbi:ABC transporter substrate-binding protein [Methylophaga sp. OBS3]|uniref:ABC transporter substrate-binding protein n=1 Tax=Methylophaga sp. OBS3 TaxID=2991934 RepID=UPI00224E3378|nr:ABC transporter substrate-binding protein [Methylophaga sp. OBS3]MCX4189759.1 ABC transporter substrate-binding protein [Methylophaga sp. OBS3]
MSCKPANEPTLKVGNIPWAGYEVLHLARALDLYPEDRIKLIELSSSTETLRALRHGQLDVGALTLDEVLRLSEQIDDLQILLITDISNGADKIIGGPNVNKLSDLKGKRIGVEEGAVGAYLLFQALQKAELTVDDITVVPSTVNQHFSLMQKRQIDAVVTFDPTGYKLQELGYKLLIDSQHIDSKIMDVLVARKSVLQTHPESLQLLIDNYWPALDYLKQHPKEAHSIIAPRLGVSVSQLGSLYQQLILPDKQESQRIMETALPSYIQQTGEFLLQQGLLTQIPDSPSLLPNYE